MNTLLFGSLIAGLIVTSLSTICPPKFCESVDCSNAPTEAQCSNGVIRDKGSYCGCCPICLKYIPVGGSCAHLHLRGTLGTSMCEPFSKCTDGICTLNDESEHEPPEMSTTLPAEYDETNSENAPAGEGSLEIAHEE